MFGFNWVDAVIFILLVGVVIEGIRVGVLSQIFVVIGFFGTLFICGRVFPYVVRFHDPTLRTSVNAALVLIAASYAAMNSFDIGQKIHWSFRLGSLVKDKSLKLLESVFGGITSLAAGLILVWLLGAMIGRMPFVGLSNSATDARIVQALTRTMPSVPAVFAEFDKHINPNAQPLVVTHIKPQAGFNYVLADVRTASAKATPSIVRITSFSCGGIVSGSGFVIGEGLVATNAHVIAGSKRPIIKYNGSSYEGVPIYFDANLDVAVLRVKQLNAPALKLVPSNVPLNTTVAVLGYPGGNYRVEPGIIRDTLATSGASIYDQGSFGRGLYQVQASVDYGDSGGPIVIGNGQVAGIIFSKSTDVSNVAYALTSVHIDDALRRARLSQLRVGTGACMVE